MSSKKVAASLFCGKTTSPHVFRRNISIQDDVFSLITQCRRVWCILLRIYLQEEGCRRILGQLICSKSWGSVPLGQSCAGPRTQASGGRTAYIGQVGRTVRVPPPMRKANRDKQRTRTDRARISWCKEVPMIETVGLCTRRKATYAYNQGAHFYHDGLLASKLCKKSALDRTLPKNSR